MWLLTECGQDVSHLSPKCWGVPGFVLTLDLMNVFVSELDRNVEGKPNVFRWYCVKWESRDRITIFLMILVGFKVLTHHSKLWFNQGSVKACTPKSKAEIQVRKGLDWTRVIYEKVVGILLTTKRYEPKVWVWFWWKKRLGPEKEHNLSTLHNLRFS